MTASQTAVDQANVLAALVEKITKLHLLWTSEECTDARVLVGCLIEHAQDANTAAEHSRRLLEKFG